MQHEKFGRRDYADIIQENTVRKTKNAALYQCRATIPIYKNRCTCSAFEPITKQIGQMNHIGETKK